MFMLGCFGNLNRGGEYDGGGCCGKYCNAWASLFLKIHFCGAVH